MKDIKGSVALHNMKELENRAFHKGRGRSKYRDFLWLLT